MADPRLSSTVPVVLDGIEDAKLVTITALAVLDGGRMASTRKSGSGPKIDEIAKGILDSYRHTDEGCPPLASQWGGYDLAKSDWLKMFADKIAVNAYRSLEAWRALEKKCDTSWIIELLYLLTFRGKCRVELDQDAYHAVSVELGKLIAAYKKLGDDLVVALVENFRHSTPLAYMGGDLLNEIRALEQSKKRLEILRDANKKWGSYKRNMRDWYLFLLAAEVIKATGRSHVKELASLIETARAAHKERTVADEDALKKRIQRWTDFLKVRLPPREEPADSADAQIPF